MNKQTGSVHVILTMLLGVALIGALGWVFYLNVTNDRRDDSAASTKDTQQMNVATVKEQCVAIEKLCFDYPSDWTVDATTVQASETRNASDEVIIKNAEGKNILSLQTGMSGLGGACDPTENDTYKLKIVDVSKAQITAMNSEDNSTSDVYAAKAIHYDKKNGYRTYMYLTSMYDKETVVDGVCHPELDGTYQSRNGDNGIVGFVTYDGRLGANSTVTYFASEDEAKKQLMSDDYMKAFEILSSARYEAV